jgi:hypothetical protein
VTWNSLEAAELVLAAATPLTVLVAGWWIKQREQINGELIKSRIDLYEQVVPLANDILVFFLGVGHWKELDPDAVIERKRRMDRIMYQYRPFWSERCWQRYDAFIRTCFVHYAAGAGRPGLLRLDAAHLCATLGPAFREEWMDRVAPADAAKPGEVQAAYDAWAACLAREIGVPERAGPAGRRPLHRVGVGGVVL